MFKSASSASALGKANASCGCFLGGIGSRNFWEESRIVYLVSKNPCFMDGRKTGKNLCEIVTSPARKLGLTKVDYLISVNEITLLFI